GEPAADLDRDDPAAIQADAAAVKEIRLTGGRRRRLAERAGDAAAAREVEQAAPLEEELALLREEQVEAGEVHLLLVDLHLREVGVVGEVGGEVGGQSVFDVAADIAGEIV